MQVLPQALLAGAASYQHPIRRPALQLAASTPRRCSQPAAATVIHPNRNLPHTIDWHLYQRTCVRAHCSPLATTGPPHLSRACLLLPFRASDFGLMKTSPEVVDGRTYERIVGFAEKPQGDELEAMKVRPAAWLWLCALAVLVCLHVVCAVLAGCCALLWNCSFLCSGGRAGGHAG